jgi:hypothetical protein
MVERPSAADEETSGYQHGRCERYFPVHFECPPSPGKLVSVRIDRVAPHRTIGTVL